MEIDASYADLARRFCDECLTLDIELASPAFWEEQSSRDCWIFGDTLEHLKDPWTLLCKVRECIPNSGVVVACIPNLQHWSIQANLSGGNFRYQESGLLDRTHLRWSTRQTIIEMFDSAGFRIDDGLPRVFDEPGREVFLPLIEQMAKAVGADSTVAVSEALAMQYVIRASPI